MPDSNDKKLVTLQGLKKYHQGSLAAGSARVVAYTEDMFDDSIAGVRLPDNTGHLHFEADPSRAVENIVFESGDPQDGRRLTVSFDRAGSHLGISGNITEYLYQHNAGREMHREDGSAPGAWYDLIYYHGKWWDMGYHDSGSGGAEGQNAFSAISVPGQATVSADSTGDTLTLEAGDNVTITTDAENDKVTISATDTTYDYASTEEAGLMSAADKAKLDGIADGANKYSLPVATASALGGVKSGADITVDSGGNVSVNDDSHNHIISNVDGLQSALDGKAASSHTHTAASSTAAGFMSAADKAKLDGIADGANKYSLPVATASALGGVKSGTDITVDSNGNVSVNDNSHAHTIANVTGLQSALDGKAASSHTHSTYVNQNAFSKVAVSGQTTVAADSATDTLTLAAGSNVTITTDATNDKVTIAAKDTTYGAATQSAAGLMSAADKTKLDGLTTGTLEITSSNFSQYASSYTLKLPATATTVFLNYAPGATGTTYIQKILKSDGTVFPNGTRLTFLLGSDYSWNNWGYFNSETDQNPYHDDMTPGRITPYLYLHQRGGTTNGGYGYAAANSGDMDLCDSNTHIDGTTAFSYIDFLFWNGCWWDGGYETNVLPYHTHDVYANPNIFQTVKAGTTTLSPDSTADTLNIVGSGSVTVTANASTDTITISGTNTTYGAATTSAAGLMSAADKAKLNGIATGANKYSLPVATASALGGVKSGTDITVDSSGNVSVNDDSHNHVISNVDGLQSALDGKAASTHYHGLSHSNSYVVIANTETDTGYKMLDSGWATSYNMLKSVRTQGSAPAWTIGNYSSGVAFGGSDTKGIITHAYSKPHIRFAGGNGSTFVWNMSITGGNGASYSLYNMQAKLDRLSLTDSGTVNLRSWLASSTYLGTGGYTMEDYPQVTTFRVDAGELYFPNSMTTIAGETVVRVMSWGTTVGDSEYQPYGKYCASVTYSNSYGKKNVIFIPPRQAVMMQCVGGSKWVVLSRPAYSELYIDSANWTRFLFTSGRMKLWRGARSVVYISPDGNLSNTYDISRIEILDNDGGTCYPELGETITIVPLSTSRYLTWTNFGMGAGETTNFNFNAPNAIANLKAGKAGTFKLAAKPDPSTGEPYAFHWIDG